MFVGHHNESLRNEEDISTYFLPNIFEMELFAKKKKRSERMITLMVVEDDFSEWFSWV